MGQQWWDTLGASREEKRKSLQRLTFVRPGHCESDSETEAESVRLHGRDETFVVHNNEGDYDFTLFLDNRNRLASGSGSDPMYVFVDLDPA